MWCGTLQPISQSQHRTLLAHRLPRPVVARYSDSHQLVTGYRGPPSTAHLHWPLLPSGTTHHTPHYRYTPHLPSATGYWYTVVTGGWLVSPYQIASPRLASTSSALLLPTLFPNFLHPSPSDLPPLLSSLRYSIYPVLIVRPSFVFDYIVFRLFPSLAKV